MCRHFETSLSRLFNKLAELALAIVNLSHKRKSHFIVPQMYGYAFNLALKDFLDVIFYLKSGTYYPYRKQNNEILYIDKQSIHPPSIIEQIQ